MHACHSVSVACRPAETRRRCGEIRSVHRSILVGHWWPNGRQRVNVNWNLDITKFLLNNPLSFDVTKLYCNCMTAQMKPFNVCWNVYIHHFLVDELPRRSCSFPFLLTCLRCQVDNNVFVFVPGSNDVCLRLHSRVSFSVWNRTSCSRTHKVWYRYPQCRSQSISSLAWRSEDV